MLIGRITKYLETGILDEPPEEVDKLMCAYSHCLGLINYKGARVGANESRRHMTHYTKGIVGSAPYRARLTQIQNAADAAVILAELAEMVAGTDGKRRFLLHVEQDDLKQRKHPGKRDGDSEGCVQAPVDGRALSPVAVP